jgi:O-antigen chain-terminating methyltransferase
MFQARDNRGEWRFQRQYQLLASGAPDGGFGGSGGGNPRAVTLGELVDCHDEEFVRNAYHKLLCREADAPSLANALERLRSGDWNKIDLLGSLRYSEEGRRVGVEVAQLRSAYTVRKLFRLPVAGYLLRSAEVLVRLPRVLGNMERFEAFTNARLTALQASHRQRSGVQPTAAAAAGLESACDAVQAHIGQQQAAPEKMQERLGALERSVRDIARVLFLSEGESQESAASQGFSAREATLDSAIQDLRGKMLGRAPSTAPAPDPRAAELAGRIDALAAGVAGFQKLLESARVDWAALRSRLGEVAKSAEGNHAAVSGAKKQQEEFRKKQERFEQSLQSLRGDIKEASKRAAVELRRDLEKTLAEAGAQNEAREALRMELVRSQMELREQIAGEIGSREKSASELRGLLDQFEASIAQLRLAAEQESGQLGRKLEAEIAAREALAFESKASADEIRATSESVSAELQRHAAQFAEEAKARDWLGSHFNEEFEKRQELEGRFKEIERAAHQTRCDLTYTDWRISAFVAEARKRLPSPLDQRQIQRIVDEHDQHSLDSLYAAFEDAFRGSREDIKARQAVYLPYIKESKAGSKKAPIVDLGCGRGEWLELLREHQLAARGVDSNRIMVKRCTELGLPAELSDAHSCLSKLKDGSAGCVTGFHIVEHIPFAALIELFDEVVRVLQPGGLVIFETPNPSNILVGSTEFYNDPTHIKPLPPRVLRFLAESRGLCNVEIIELHPYPQSYTFEADEKGVAQRLNQYFYGPQDYSIIGRKP